jgi:putative mRNA 3-end processing factor
MKAWFDDGLHFISGGIHFLFDPSSWFDPHPRPPEVKEPVDIVLVTHGHADHCNQVKKYAMKKKKGKLLSVPVVMHPATRDITTWWLGAKRYTLIRQGQSCHYLDAKIEAFEAGHCIGSLQYRVTTSECTFTFTGDVNSTPGSLALNKGEIVPSDYIAIDSTMGNPSHVMKSREIAYSEIYKFIKEKLFNGSNSVAIYGQSLGKVQEIVKFLWSIEGFDAKVAVDSRSRMMNDVYEKYRGYLGKYHEINEGSFSDEWKTVIVHDLYSLKKSKVPPLSKFNGGIELPSIIVSAFGHEDTSYPVLFMSSHDDFDGIYRYIVDASEIMGKKPVILPFHGEHESFTKEMQLAGYDATDPHVDVINRSD